MAEAQRVETVTEITELREAKGAGEATQEQIDSAREKVLAIESEMNDHYVEREEPIRGLVIGLMAGEHVLLLGPPGTAKSELTEDLCGRIGGEYFRWLLARTSAPEELLGPISLKALENDSYRRVPTGKLPEAHVAFLDEIFKCNSAVLNNLLSVLNERVFFNDGKPVAVPIEMVVGASNELPSDREELSAIWDRFMLRFRVGYIQESGHFIRVLKGEGRTQDKTHISLEELKVARDAVEAVDVSGILDLMLDVKDALAKKSLRSSDRRYAKAIGLVKAHAFLEGHTVADEDDLKILSAVLWEDPEEERIVKQEIQRTINPVIQEIDDIRDQITESWRTAMDDPSVDLNAGQEVLSKLTHAYEQVKKLIEDNKNRKKNLKAANKFAGELKNMREELIKKCLQVSGQ